MCLRAATQSPPALDGSALRSGADSVFGQGGSRRRSPGTLFGGRSVAATVTGEEPRPVALSRCEIASDELHGFAVIVAQPRR
jgi:hypothetical protein